MRRSSILAAALFAVLLPALIAENWPQWRGPSSLGVSSETDLPVEWSADDNVAWKAELAGLGASSPIVWDDHVIVTSQIGETPVARGDGSHPLLARDDETLAETERAIGGGRRAPDRDVTLVVEAFRLSDGERLFEFRAPARGPFPATHEKHNLATPTPATDGERIYAWFGNGQLFALDFDGELVWERHLAEDYGSFLNNWGHGSSPALVDGRLVLLCDHDSNAYLLALDARTGEEVWKADRGRDRISHATPLVVPGDDGKELVINSTERVDAYDPETGELLWHFGDWRQTPIPTPVFADGRIYMSRGYRNSDYLAVRPGGRGDVTETHIDWREPNGASYVPSIVHYQGLLYMTNEVGVVTCADAETGEKLWRRRLRGVFFASPTAGDGKVYLTGESGDVFVLKAGRKPVELAVNSLGVRLMASPAISGGKLFFRGDNRLFAVGE